MDRLNQGHHRLLRLQILILTLQARKRVMFHASTTGPLIDLSSLPSPQGLSLMATMEDWGLSSLDNILLPDISSPSALFSSPSSACRPVSLPFFVSHPMHTFIDTLLNHQNKRGQSVELLRTPTILSNKRRRPNPGGDGTLTVGSSLNSSPPAGLISPSAFLQDILSGPPYAYSFSSVLVILV